MQRLAMEAHEIRDAPGIPDGTAALVGSCEGVRECSFVHCNVVCYLIVVLKDI